jgi:hypothetical protein
MAATDHSLNRRPRALQAAFVIARDLEGLPVVGALNMNN